MCDTKKFPDKIAMREWIFSHDPLIVVAGHYSLADYLVEVSNTGEAEIASFTIGVTLVKMAIARGQFARLVLLINDIGVDEKKRTAVKTRYTPPDNYSNIMQKEGLDPNHLVVIFESSVRNKASTLLRKLYKHQPHLFERRKSNERDLIRCVDKSDCNRPKSGSSSAYVIKGPNGEKLVVKEGPSPKCNLILATFFRDLRRKFGPQLIVNVFNNIYQRRVHLGLFVGREILYNSTPVLNLFCDGENIVDSNNAHGFSTHIADFGYALNQTMEEVIMT